MNWANEIGKHLIKECKITIGNETKQIALRKNDEIKYYDIKYNHLKKQTYTEKEFNDKINLILNNKNKMTEKYPCIERSKLVNETIIDIVDYIYEDYIDNTYDKYWQIITLYNNIVITLQNDCDITDSYIEFIYIDEEINKNDLEILKEVFAFIMKD